MPQFRICIERNEVFEGVIEATTLEEAIAKAEDDLAEHDGQPGSAIEFVACTAKETYEVPLAKTP